MAKPKVNRVLYNPIEKQFEVVSRYQYYLFGVLFLSKIPIFWHVLSLLFVTPRMNYYCEEFDGSIKNLTLNVCPCNHPRWDKSVFTATLQTKFNTMCEKKYLIGLSQSMLYLGALLGSLVFGVLSDKFGRLSTFCISVLFMALFGCIVVVMPTMASYTFVRALEGLGIGGAIVTGYVLCVEYCGVKQREVVSALFHIPLNIGHMSLAGVSYLLRDCDQFQLAISIPLFFFIAMKWCLFESPKWLMDCNRIDEAASVMKKISKFNGTTCGEVKTAMVEYQSSHSNTGQKMQFWHIFQHRQLIINFFAMAAIYFICGMGYYGVSQYIGHMSGDIHLNVAISGLTLIPGTIAATFLLLILSRRTFLIATSFASGILMICVILIPSENTWARVIIACICNCAFFMSFIIVFLYGVELFPTAVRNSVLGILSVMSRAGQIVAPLINQLPQTASGGIFGGLAILGGFLCIPLPETKNVELPSSLEDSKTLPRKKSQGNSIPGIELTST